MLCIYIALFQLSYKKSKSIENDLFKMKDVDAAKIHSVYSSPQPFWHQGLVSWKTMFPWTRGGSKEGCFWNDSLMEHTTSVSHSAIHSRV